MLGFFVRQAIVWQSSSGWPGKAEASLASAAVSLVVTYLLPGSEDDRAHRVTCFSKPFGKWANWPLVDFKLMAPYQHRKRWLGM